MKKLILPLIFLSACATTHPGKLGSPVKGQQESLPLKISGYSPNENVGQPFQLIEVTLENTSIEWLRVSRARVIIDNPVETKLSVVTGSDLQNWAAAMKEKGKLDEQNKSIFKSGLLVAGIIAAGSEDSGVATVGTIAALGAYGWIVSDILNESKEMAERPEQVPQGHLYKSFSVPGRMFLRKWILFNKPVASTITKVILEIETAENKKETYAISL